MRRWRILTLVAAFLSIGAVAFTGCSKSGNPTSPYGGGMGGGGGAGGSSGSGTPFNSGTLTAPASFEHSFPLAGAIGYHCNFHGSLGMVGTVIVSSSAMDSTATVTAAGMSFTPATVTIRPGGVVHWSVTSGTHTVTSD